MKEKHWLRCSRTGRSKFMVGTIAVLTLSAVVWAATNAQLTTSKRGFAPTEGFIPDAKTAIRVAEAVAEPLVGEVVLKKHKPLHARLRGNTWIVTATPSNELGVKGGDLEVRIEKQNGCILFVDLGK